MKNNLFKNGKLIFFRKQNNILSAAVVLMVMILFSGLLGLIRDRLLAGYFFHEGKQWQLDIYFAAFRIPDMLFQVLILGTLSSAFIPVFSEYLVKDKKEANSLADAVITIGILIYFVLSSIIFVFSKQLSAFITHSIPDYQLTLMSNLTRILLIAEGIFAISNFFSAILQTHQRFLLPAFSAVLYNLGIILGIIIFSPFLGIYGPIIGVLFGSMLHGIFQYPLIRKLGFRFRPIVNFNQPGIKKIAKLMVPRTLSFALDQVNLSITVFIATALASGSLAIFNFAQHLSNLPVSLFGLTIGQAALPILSREANTNRDNFKNILRSSLKQIAYLAMPVGIILLILRIPAVRLTFGTKNFPWEATIVTGKIVGILSLSLFAQCFIELLIRAFYALQDTKTTLVLKSIIVIFGTGLSYLFVFGFHWGILGLAAANSLTNLMYAILLILFLDKKIGGLLQSVVLKPLLKIFLATILAGFALWLPMRFLDRFILDTTRTVNLIILTLVTLLVGGGIYLLFSRLLKINQLNHFLAVLKRFGQWRQILAESDEIIDETQN